MKEVADLLLTIEPYLPCKLGDTVYEVACCMDDVYRMFPMVVKSINPFGSVRWIKDKEPIPWNIYAEGDGTYMYKSFYDIGRTLFFDEESAREEVEKHRSERLCKYMMPGCIHRSTHECDTCDANGTYKYKPTEG